MKNLRKLRIIGLVMVFIGVLIITYTPALISGVDLGVSGFYYLAGLGLGLFIILLGIILIYLG